MRTPGDGGPLPERSPDGVPARRGNAVAQGDVVEMFDRITPVYDRLNTLMTLRLDGHWRRMACASAGLRPGGAAVDVACGTGKLSVLLADTVGPFGRVEAVDLSGEMIQRATRTYRDRVQLHFSVGDALSLPFGGGEFDAATIAFGLRNLPDFEAGFRELARVVRPGGRVVCLELSLPRWRPYARAFHLGFRTVAPIAGAIVGRQAQAYRYLPDSLDGFPSPETLADHMRDAGLTEVTFRRLATGVAALHCGRVPGVRAGT